MIWDKFISDVKDVWKRIWNQKYNMPETVEGRLRAEEIPKGSSIWELASQNRDIVNNHAVWEIREGSNARFWEEGWQQRDKLARIQTLQEVQQKAKRAGLEYVRDY